MKSTVRAFRSTATRWLLIAILAASGGCSGGAGERGADGSSTLLRTTSVAPGGECPNGGSKVDTGADQNADGQLADGEVDFTVFVCDGADGESVAATLVPPGATCPAGVHRNARLARAAACQALLRGRRPPPAPQLVPNLRNGTNANSMAQLTSQRNAPSACAHLDYKPRFGGLRPELLERHKRSGDRARSWRRLEEIDRARSRPLQNRRLAWQH